MRPLLLLLMAAILSLPETAFAASEDLPGNAKRTLHRLKKESGDTFAVHWDSNTNTPSLLAGNLSKPSKHSPQWIAYEFLNKTKTLYGLKNSRTDMEVTEVTRRTDQTIQVRLRHLLYKTPVWKDELLIQMNEQGVVQRVEGKMHRDLNQKTFNRAMHPSFSQTRAVELALSASKMDKAKLGGFSVEMYYHPAILGAPLIYAVNLRSLDSNDPTRQILIHALSKRIIEQTVIEKKGEP